jgi:hypothetical protein
MGLSPTPWTKTTKSKRTMLEDAARLIKCPESSDSLSWSPATVLRGNEDGEGVGARRLWLVSVVHLEHRDICCEP